MSTSPPKLPKLPKPESETTDNGDEK
ncbi:hypothetical protein A2U01_0088523, partial [Trifolium medium]|nr:hypothetical protein [Trifolium medium]